MTHMNFYELQIHNYKWQTPMLSINCDEMSYINTKYTEILRTIAVPQAHGLLVYQRTLNGASQNCFHPKVVVWSRRNKSSYKYYNSIVVCL